MDRFAVRPAGSLPPGLVSLLYADAELAAMLLDMRDLLGDSERKKPALPAIEAAKRLSQALKAK